mgnify:CR=1 FL=1
MNITFYTCTADTIKADKSGSLTTLKTVTSAQIIGDMNILSPRIKVVADADTKAANYCYISDFDRYYFVKDKVGLSGTHIELLLENDLRYNFLSVIQNSDVTASRSNMYNKNIPDPMVLTVPQENITYRKLSEALTGESYIAIIGG